jgi:L-alanine-DL-glutamate epimerase-like enolase superfamily enzyme
MVGRGESAPSDRYGESFSDCIEILNTFSSTLPDFEDLQEFENYYRPYFSGVSSLKTGLSMAMLDLLAQHRSQPVHEMLGFVKAITQPTSYTIAIGDLKLLKNKIQDASDYQILKIKLGSGKDKEIVERIREETDKVIRVDANEGWSLSEAMEMCSWLEDKNVELIEQPLKDDELPLMGELKHASPIPLIADESCLKADDVPQ